MRSYMQHVAALAALLLLAADVAAEEHFRDPTRPYSARAVVYGSTPAAFKVNALIVSDERRLAIVNGRRVRIGDAIGGATVVGITKQELTLDIGGERRTLKLTRSGAR